MKIKLLFVIAFLFLIAPQTFAEDCMHDPIYERDWNAVITTGARVRNIPCMETSVVLTTVPVGQVVHVIGETDGYYKIETSSGTVGWAGQWLMAATDKAFSATPAPAPEPAPKTSSNACGLGDPLSDICGHAYGTAIGTLFSQNVVGGYPDGSFKPDASINRAEFVKIIVASVLQYDPAQDPSGFDLYSTSGLSFSDVESGAWYIPYLRKAVQGELIAGYPDGSFKPSQKINVTEAAKILAVAFKLKLGAEGNAWYKPYLEPLQAQRVIPTSLQSLSQSVTRGEMSEMIWRLMEGVTNKPFKRFSLL